jgi:hypothetical protein
VQVGRFSWSENGGWLGSGLKLTHADLVFYFGPHDSLLGGTHAAELKALFPSAHQLGCSTGGQILGQEISDDGVVALALGFKTTRIRVIAEPLIDGTHSEACGSAIGAKLASDDLAGIFVLSDGLKVNGSSLVAGIVGVTGGRVPVAGGLAGDDARFMETLVGADCTPQSGLVGAVGFYGPEIRVGHGSAGGWDVFRPAPSNFSSEE